MKLAFATTVKNMFSRTMLLIFITIFFAGITALADITVGSYCQITIQSMQQEISNMQELIDLVNQYKSDPSELIKQEEIKKAEFEEAKKALLTSFGTTEEEIVFYMGENSKAVNEYLEKNPDIKQQIDNLSTQVNNLLFQYESLKGHDPNNPPQSQ